MRVIPIVILGSLLIAVTPGASHAHADAVRTTPRNGSVVAQAPEVVTVTFSEAVTVASARLQGAGGRDLPSSAQIAGPVLTITPIASLRTERIVTASWTVRSDDGHSVSGASAFVIGNRAPTGKRIVIQTLPRVLTALSSDRPGTASLEVNWPATSGRIEWTCADLAEPLTWSVRGIGRKSTASGVLPWPGTWLMRGQLVNREGQVMEVRGQVVLKP